MPMNEKTNCCDSKEFSWTDFLRVKPSKREKSSNKGAGCSGPPPAEWSHKCVFGKYRTVTLSSTQAASYDWWVRRWPPPPSPDGLYSPLRNSWFTQLCERPEANQSVTKVKVCSVSAWRCEWGGQNDVDQLPVTTSLLWRRSSSWSSWIQRIRPVNLFLFHVFVFVWNSQESPPSNWCH